MPAREAAPTGGTCSSVWRWLSALEGLWAWGPQDTWGGHLLLPPPESLAARPSSGGLSSPAPHGKGLEAPVAGSWTIRS